MRRFFLPEGPREGQALLSGQEYQHLVRVLRLRVGEEVVLFDGRGREWLARIEEVGERQARLEVVSELAAGAAEPALEVWLAQALLKRPAAEWLVQKACELGVRRLTFVSTERSVPRPAGGEEGAERWRRLAASALKQCRGCFLPRIDPPLSLDELLAEPFEGARLVLHEGQGVGLSEAVAAAGGRRMCRVQLLVGPEGGFSGSEIERAVRAGFVAVRLSARVLRAETAALAVCAALLYAAGELG